METDEFFKHAREEMFPKMKSSALSVTIVPPDGADPDPKLCMELGAAILFDKPIILMVPAGRTIPANLRRVAATIVQGDMSDPSTGERLQNAITHVIENDARVS
jgi:hypothetical protein